MIITFLTPYITFLLETQWFKNSCEITYTNWYYIVQYSGFLVAFAPYYIIKVLFILLLFINIDNSSINGHKIYQAERPFI